MRAIAGRLTVVLLNILACLPLPAVMTIGSLLLPLYIPFRRRTRERLGKLTPPLSPIAYYRMRLRLALLSLRHILGKPDGCRIVVEGGELFADALASGYPVALLGWHQGPVELLHELPAIDASFVGRRASGDGTKFFVMTARAFSPALSEWMTSGRRALGTSVIRPGDTAALRAWVRQQGVLAVMVDQVPGRPEGWLTLRDGMVRVPWPQRLTAWIATRHPVCLAVSVRWEVGDRIVFRYDRIEPGALKEEVARLMEKSLSRAPEQYNWSYPKLRVD